MTAGAIPTPPLSATLSSLRGAAPALLLGLLWLVVLFQAEATAAIRVWNDSTAYNHCYLVVPIAAYMIWDRRAALRGLAVHPLPWTALLALPLSAAWLVAERLGIMEGRQLVAVSFLQVLALSVLGWRLWWALSGPLLYLYFLVPFGEFIVPKLQDVTTAFVRHGLKILQIPAFIDGYIIEIPEGTFFIAEACAGLRFLIASIAFGCLYALMMYRSPGRRLAFVAASIVIPVLANGVRALGIVWLGHMIGSAQAAAADHVIYGWVFFSTVILLLILVGLPFREDNQPEPPPLRDPEPVATPRSGALTAALALTVIAAAAPAVVARLDHRAAMLVAAPRPLDLAPDCTTLSVEPVRGAPGSRELLLQRVACGDLHLELRITVLPPGSTAAPLLAERSRLTRAAAVDDAMLTPVRGPGEMPVQWRLMQVTEPPLVVASALWVEGVPAGGGMAMRAHMARDSLTGGRFAPVVVTVTPAPDWSHFDGAAQRAIVARLVAFLQTDRRIDQQVRLLAAAR